MVRVSNTRVPRKGDRRFKSCRARHVVERTSLGTGTGNVRISWKWCDTGLSEIRTDSWCRSVYEDLCFLAGVEGQGWRVMEVLVLDGSWQPLRRVPWQRAISWWIQGRVEVVMAYPDRVIRTVSESIPMPAVVRFLGKVIKRWLKRGLRFTRENVWLRDHGQCQYCGCDVTKTDMTYDHVVPRSQGGLTVWTNIVASCKPCNRRKGDRTPTQAKMALRSNPVVPSHLGGKDEALFIWTDGMPLEWQAFSV